MAETFIFAILGIAALAGMLWCAYSIGKVDGRMQMGEVVKRNRKPGGEFSYEGYLADWSKIVGHSSKD
jgi:hypothetical protein